MEVIAIFVFFIGLAVVFRLMAFGFDRDRVDRHFRSRGGRVLDQRWSPFGRGWFGDKSNHIYEIRYEDRDGNIHHATCKTSMFSGVYLTDDRIVHHHAEEKTED